MSKISELGPIKGANTRSEDLFVIVNLIQGDDGTKNITRKELVAAIQYEVFDRITITGGNISGVRIFNSTIEDNVMNRNTFNNGLIDDSDITSTDIVGGTMIATEVANVTILSSDFSDGTGNNNVFTNTIVDFGALNNSTGNNDTFTNSTIDDSFYNNVTIDQGTANGLILTNIEIDELILEDAFISNSTIITTDFSNGTIRSTIISGNTEIFDVAISNSTIINTDLDDVDITNSRFSNGFIWDTLISNSSIIDTTANNVTITSSALNDSTANNTNITNSDFSNGTGTDNTFTNPILENATLTGAMDQVVATNISIGSSTSDDLVQQRSTIQNSDISESEIANSTIIESDLVDFDMELTKVFEPMLDEDSYFALKNVQTGDTEKMTYRQLYDEVSRKTEKSLKVHVASDGDDKYSGSILQPVRTLKRAEQLALQKAGGSYDRNDLNNAVHISVGPGSYYVDEPIMLPDDCSMTSTAGQYATVIQKKKGWEKTNGILVGSGCYVQGFGYMNFEVDNFDQPEGGFAIAYRPGALLRRSPYIRDSSQLSNFNRLDVEPPLNPFNSKGNILDLGQEFYLVAGHSAQNQFEVDDEVTFSSGATGYVSYITDIDSARQIYVRNLKGNVEVGDILYAQRGGTGTIESIGIDDFPNRLVGRGGGCLLADRAVLDTDSLYTYVLCFGFTPRTQNGTGYVAKNGAGVNGIGSLSIFTRQAFFALDGGQMTLNNSGSQFGDISMRARGSTVIIKPAQANQALIIANTAFADSLETNKAAIVDDMIDYLTANTSTGFNGAPGLGYQGYNADKCFRDTGLLVDSTMYDVATRSNYWGRLNGITYRSPISYVVTGEQYEETDGSIRHIKDEINHIFTNELTGGVQDRVNASLNETISILQYGEEAATPITFADTGDQAAVAARELVQDNRPLIINEFVNWIDNNDDFYAYDSVKCARDIEEYILPAAAYDIMNDTNYNSVTTGLAYYVNTARTSLENQRNETVASFERLRKTSDEVLQGWPVAQERNYKAFNTIINALANSGKKYTPTKATYDPVTGSMVITIGEHDLAIGRYVNLSKESFTFKCSSDNFKNEISHPRVTDKAYLAALPIVEVSAKTITVNPGLGKANFEHRFVSAKADALSVIGDQITFSDADGIAVERRNARKQLQQNRIFAQDYMMDWVDQEFYFYDSKKCHRDTEEYILPAVQRDMILGTNYNSIQTGAAYRTKSGEVSVTDQLVQTVGSINYLKAQTAALLTNPIAEDRANLAFDEMTRLLNNNGKKYTPTNAVYYPVYGTTVLYIGSHDFKIGDSIIIEPNSLTFTCELDGNATTHTYPTTEFINYSPTGATYDPVTGEFSVSIGAHALKAGDLIEFKPSSIVFTCELDGNVTNHPAPESHHPFYKKQIVIDSVDGTTVYMNVGGVTDGGGVHTFVSASANAIQAEKRHPAYKKPIVISDVGNGNITVNVGESTDTSVHTFVSATTNAVREADMWEGKFTPQTATYDPVSGDMVLTIGSHDLPVGKWIEIAPESMIFSCQVDDDPFSVGYDAAPQYDHPAYKEPVRVKEVTFNTITVNVGNANGHTNNHTFVSATPNCIDANALYFSDPAKVLKSFTPTDATYDPVTGVFVVTIADHGLTTDDHIELQPQSFVFSCAANGGGNDFSPRIGDYAYKLPLKIDSVTTDTVTVNCGSAGTNTDVHTFVSADQGAVVKVRATTQGTYAARILQKNKPYLQGQVTSWLDNNYYTYSKAKCERDTGYILNAVARDIATGSNLNAIYTGLGYRIGTVGAQNLINTQLTETVGAITWLKGEIAADVLAYGISVTRSNAAFDEIIDIMTNGKGSADTVSFGPQSISTDAYNARAVLQANKTFIQKEVIAWIADQYFLQGDFVYDQVACERDIGIFIDTASFDLQHGGNAATINNLRLYWENALPVLAAEEIKVTSSVYEFVADLVGKLVRGETATPIQGVETQVYINETSHTPTNATYDPVGGMMVLTIGSHGYAVNDRITIDPEAITFQCGFGGGGTDSHPNANDPKLGKPFIIEEITGTTISVYAGPAGTNTDAHTFVSATADSVRNAAMPDAYTPTDIAYNHLTGVMEMTLGARHRFAKGDYVIFDENAITLSCASNGGGNLSHPRPTDPIFNKPVRIDSVTSTTITLQVGPATVDAVHTFVSATTNGVRRSLDVVTTNRAMTLFSTIGETILNNDGVVPEVEEPIYILDGRFDNPSIVQYGPGILGDAQRVLGEKPKYQSEIIKYISETYNGLGYDKEKCPRDAGYIIDAISEDIEYGGDAATIHAAGYYFNGAISVLEPYSMEATKLVFQQLAADMKKVAKNVVNEPIFGARFTPTNATYDTATGILVATIGAHTLTTDDHIWFTPDAITFSCDTGAGATNHASPEAHHRFYNKACPVIGVTSTTITLWVGAFVGGTTHTFVSALTDGLSEINGNLLYQNVALPGADTATGDEIERLALIIANIVDDRLVIPDYRGSLDISQQTPVPLPIPNAATRPYMEPSRTYARKSLQWNREFIQEEVVQFVKDNTYTYDEDKCARDVGFIIDAVARDVRTGSNYSSIYAGKAYLVQSPLAQNVIMDQIAETIEAMEYVRDDILPRLTGVALTRATSAFTNVIQKMVYSRADDIDEAAAVDNVLHLGFGIANVSPSNAAANDGLLANTLFLQAEAIRYIAITNPSLTYDTDKCKRDVGLLVEAIAFDIQHGSNTGVRDFAKLYFENGILVGLPLAQRIPTATLYIHLGAVAEQVVLKQAVTPSAGSIAADEVQVLSGFGNVVGATGVEVEKLFTVVSDIIVEDSLINLPQEREPTVTDAAATGYDQEASVDIILGRKDTLGSSVVQYLSETFDYLQYSEERCRRDTGYIVDAISHDIQYGGNAAMHGTAELYFKNAINVLPIDQRQSTREAFEYLGTVVERVIRHEAIPRNTFNRDPNKLDIKQATPLGATYNPLTGIMVVQIATAPARHWFQVGNYVQIAPESIVFTCTLDGNIATHPSPQIGDPYYNTPNKILAATATSITLYVGKVPYGKGGGAHTFVSGALNAITLISGNTVKQEMPTIAASRTIATEAMNLATMLAKVADDNDASNIPARIDPTTFWIDPDLRDQKILLDNVSAQMATDLQGYIYDTYNGISYSKEKCRRDVGTMIDAISHDVQYATNYATVQTAGLYFVNAVSVLPVDQRQQTAKFFTKLGDVLSQIVVGGTVDTSIVSHSTGVQDTTTHLATTADRQEEVNDLVRIVEDAVRRDSIDTIPAIIEPANDTWQQTPSVGYIPTAARTLIDNRQDLSDDVTQFLKDTFTIVDYSKAKCRRDAGYIVDAMSWDLNYGGNLATRWNANFYFWNNELKIPEDTRAATAKAYRQLGKIVSQVVLGEYPGQKIRTDLGTEVQSIQADELGMIFYNSLFYNDVNKLGPLTNPNFAWEYDKTFSFAKEIIGNNKIRIQRETQRFITSTYKFIDLPKTYRDAGNFLNILQNDFRYIDVGSTPDIEGSDAASRSFVGALFNIDAQHVFPVFNPPAGFADWRKLRFKGTVASVAARDALTGMKRWDTYIIPTDNNVNRYVGQIFHWTGTTWASVGANNTDLLDSFTGAWTQMKTYINNNIAPNQTHRDMVTELIDNVIIDSIIRPDFLVFGSLVESIAHQFNGASAGVNRNALPLNFRNVGAAIGANASVLSENGGRIRWSGSDELNNQYFARGLKINGRTGRIEGRPFTSSVRKLARRASNSRASL